MMVCSTCHEPDGRGTTARKTMKDAEQIPDLTDPKWQASRTDAELAQSILEGKGKVMLPRKDILGVAHTDVKEMVALMRSFQGGKKVVTGVPTGQPVAANPVPSAGTTAPTGPAAPPLAQGVTATGSSPPAAVPSGPTTTPLAMTLESPVRTQTTLSATGSGQPQGASASPMQVTASPGASVPALGATGAVAPPAGPAPDATGPVASLPAALPLPSAASPERAAKLNVAADFYRTNCFACHGMDGKGSVVRPLMPAIPDFTSREWQVSRTNTQLQTSILEGKGTLMPPWTGKFSAGFAKDLISYVRTFGPPDLLASGSETSVASSNFEIQVRALRAQWDEVEKQLQALNLPPARP
jgi:mono/diheme cytochrome c family protein